VSPLTSFISLDALVRTYAEVAPLFRI
jgi:hypothetical protein